MKKIPHGVLFYRSMERGKKEKLPQNHRIDRVGRNLWRSFSPTPLAKVGSPVAGNKGTHPGGVWMSPGREAPQSL